jgi:hypothetical protein
MADLVDPAYAELKESGLWRPHNCVVCKKDIDGGWERDRVPGEEKWVYFHNNSCWNKHINGMGPFGPVDVETRCFACFEPVYGTKFTKQITERTNGAKDMIWYHSNLACIEKLAEMNMVAIKTAKLNLAYNKEIKKPKTKKETPYSRAAPRRSTRVKSKV